MIKFVPSFCLSDLLHVLLLAFMLKKLHTQIILNLVRLFPYFFERYLSKF